jgi:uncharacterized protein involved in exopolysaccharide biosynthesis
MTSASGRTATETALDLGALLRSLARLLPYLIVFSTFIGASTYLLLGQVTPVYRAEAVVRTGIDPADPRLAEALSPEIQFIRSHEIAAGVADRLRLDDAEARAVIRSASPLGGLLADLGFGREPDEAAREGRLLALYQESLAVAPLGGTADVAVAFHATDPVLAANVANAVAEAYVELRRSAAERLKQQRADYDRRAAAVSADIAALEAELAALTSAQSTPEAAAAERDALKDERESLLDAAAIARRKAAALRAGLSSGRLPAIEGPEAAGLGRLIAQQRLLEEELERQSEVLLAGHPMLAELKARLAEIGVAAATEARRIAERLEAEAREAQARVLAIEQQLPKAEAGMTAAARHSIAAGDLEKELAARRAELRGLGGGGERSDPAARTASLLARADPPEAPEWPNLATAAGLAAVVAFLLAAAAALLRLIATGRGRRPVAFEPLPVVKQTIPVGGRLPREGLAIRRMAAPAEPSLAPLPEIDAEASLAAVADTVVGGGMRRVLVTMAEGPWTARRPLAAVALARSLSRRERRVVLLDLHDDGADAAAMGDDAEGLPGFADLLSGAASFAQVIFRDRRSRAHFIAAGLGHVPPSSGIDADRLGIILAALDHTYDHVVIDCPDRLVAAFAPDAEAALVASEFAATDPRTTRAFAAIATVSPARILLLNVEPAREPAAAVAA